MNLNQLILANITESAYFRTDLVQHRTYEDMVDEIYYRVQHLEPWEKVSSYKVRTFVRTKSRDREKHSPAAQLVGSGV